MKPCPLLFASLALAAVLPCQHEPARAADKATKAPFVFEPGVVDVRTLIERCGAYLQCNILLDEAELGGGRQQRPAAKAADAAPEGPFVALQLPVVTDRDGCEELLGSLLWTRGLALVPLDEQKGVYEVLSVHGPRAREIPLRAVLRTPAEVLARPHLRQFVTVVQELEHTNATIATNALRPFFATSGGQQGVASLTLGNVGTATSMVLTGPQDLVASALQMLKAADVPQPPEVRPELTARLDALASQNAQLLQRVAALEEKLGKGR